MNQWNTIDESVEYRCEAFDIVNETVELPDGTRTEFDYLRESESVVILPFTPDGEVIVIDEWRHAVKRTNRGLPAGGVESGESPEEAVDRELAEETGYEPGDVTFLTTMEPANGFSDAVFHFFVANDCREVAGQELDRDETITVSTAQFEDLVADLDSGRLRDGRSAFAILFYQCFSA